MSSTAHEREKRGVPATQTRDAVLHCKGNLVVTTIVNPCYCSNALLHALLPTPWIVTVTTRFINVVMVLIVYDYYYHAYANTLLQ